MYFLKSRTVWSRSLMAVSWSWMDDLSAPSTSTPGRALCAAAAVSPSRDAASRRWAVNSTPSTLCAPSACNRSTTASSRSRMGSPTVPLALTNCLCQSCELPKRNTHLNSKPVITCNRNHSIKRFYEIFFKKRRHQLSYWFMRPLVQHRLNDQRFPIRNVKMI